MMPAIRKAMFSHFAGHVSVRLVSAALSFFVFALIARRLETDEARGAFAFLFALGFGVATVRLCVQLLAGVNGASSLTLRTASVFRGIAFGALTLPLLMPILVYALWLHSGSGLITFLGCLVVVAAVCDLDLIRGILRRAPLFSSFFLLGAALASAGIFLQPDLTKTSAIGWILVQWLPISVANVSLLIRAVIRGWVPPVNKENKRRLLQTWSALVTAGFDGFVLNIPFLGWAGLAGAAGADFSLGMRVFVGSLLMHPLLLHWTNSSHFAELLRLLRLSGAFGFSTILGLSSLLAGSAMFLFYALIATRTPSSGSVSVFLILAACYSFYAGELRMSAPAVRGVGRVICAALPFAGLALAMQSGPVGASPVLLSAVQGGALVVSGVLLRVFVLLGRVDR